jgi:hypothetical protein
LLLAGVPHYIFLFLYTYTLVVFTDSKEMIQQDPRATPLHEAKMCWLYLPLPRKKLDFQTPQVACHAASLEECDKSC